MTALAAGAAVTAGLALPDDGAAEAAERPRYQVTADKIADRDAVDPRSYAARHHLEVEAAEFRKKRAARIKAAKQRAEARERAARAAERKRLRSMDPRSIARSLLDDYGFSSGQFGCLSSLWQKESGWNLHATNPSSGAYGIPQALPGSKMGSVAGDWRTNPVTQIKWGLQYIRASYGSPCAAWGHSQASGWY